MRSSKWWHSWLSSGWRRDELTWKKKCNGCSNVERLFNCRIQTCLSVGVILKIKYQKFSFCERSPLPLPSIHHHPFSQALVTPYTTDTNRISHNSWRTTCSLYTTHTTHTHCEFSRFRRGDRYFFEHSPSINPGAFKEGQLQQLRLTSLSRIICDNADGFALSSVAPKAFWLPHVQGFVRVFKCWRFFFLIISKFSCDFRNTPVPCTDSVSIPIMDYSHWKEWILFFFYLFLFFSYICFLENSKAFGIRCIRCVCF